MTGGSDAWFERCVGFLEAIGIAVEFTTIEHDCVLPGFRLTGGRVQVDMGAMRYPGDLLHEAAHIAVVPADERITLSAESIGQRPGRDAEEMMAIAWSYAAAVYLDIHPYFVFHQDGYQGGGNEIADNFMDGRYFGVPMLQWTGMCAAGDADGSHYPAMLKWLRD